MIRVRVGDLFESRAQTLVNTVNCVGVMGKGVALEFRNRFTRMYADYVERWRAGQVRLGEPYLYKDLVGPWVLNFPTKDHWRSVSRLSDIEAGLEHLERHYREWGITSLAVPPLGCGHGGLEWRVVGPTLYRYLARLDIPVELYAPHGTPERELTSEFLASARTASLVGEEPLNGRIRPAWIALVAILHKVTKEPYHWPVGRTAFQKLAYFATVAGLPTGLAYTRGSYGPFSPNVKPLITSLVNQGLLKEQKVGNMIRVRPGPTFRDAVQLIRSEDVEAWKPIVERVVDLMLRMQQQDAEIAGSVHFEAESQSHERKRRPTELEVFEGVKRWKARRRPPLPEDRLKGAVRHLNLLGWIDLEPSPELEPEEEELALA
jgi:O-acetyl-ADP-ribose deacetylase (regulator of RNase III)/uncharacterized protein YwgA